jgi:serine/threonine-protein kinase
MLLGLVAGMGAVVAGGFYLWLATAPPEVRVPDVTGINVRAAEEILARRGLIAHVVARHYNEKAPADTVLAAAPPAGKTVRQGRIIELILSDGPPTALAPDVRDMELAQASRAITAADLRLARIRRRYDERVPAGWVMEQRPEPGVRVARRAGIEVVISAGPTPRVSPPETPPAATEEPLGPAHYAVVQVTLPEGDRPAAVRIEVEDRRGTTVAYSMSHDPGSTISQVVTGYGEATARVYVDDRLIEEKRF